MKLTENPFLKFSAEEEATYISKIYYNPQYFSGLLDEIKGNNTRVVFGERGSGKSAMMIAIKDKFQENENKQENNLSIVIDDYSFLISRGNNIRKRWLIFLIRNLLKIFIQTMLVQKRDLSKLDKIEKEKLTFIIMNFYQTISQTDFTKFQTSHKIYNDTINPVMNTAINLTLNLTTDLVSKSLGLSQLTENSYKEYLPKMDTAKPIEILELEEHVLLQIFDDLANICHKMGFTIITFFMDKIDEDQEIGGKIREETELLEPILLNTRILFDNKFSFVFFLWSKVKEELCKKSVRFDKIKSIDVSWTQKDLREMMEKRINYFSSGGIRFEQLFQEVNCIDQIIHLANGSPRDLLRLLSSVYDEENSLSNSLNLFSSASVNKGIIRFLSNYNFPSL